MNDNGLVLFYVEDESGYFEVVSSFDEEGNKILQVESGIGDNFSVTVLSEEDASRLTSSLLGEFLPQ